MEVEVGVYREEGAEDGDGFRKEEGWNEQSTGWIYSCGDKAPAVPSCVARLLLPEPLLVPFSPFPSGVHQCFDMEPGTHCSLASSRRAPSSPSYSYSSPPLVHLCRLLLIH